MFDFFPGCYVCWTRHVVYTYLGGGANKFYFLPGKRLLKTREESAVDAEGVLELRLW